MKRSLWFVIALILLWSVVSCNQYQESAQKQQEARAGLDVLVSQQPRLTNFDPVKDLYFDTSFTAYGKTCYYATAYMIIGSSLSESDALDIYTQALQDSGWIPREKQYEDARVLYSGTNSRAVVSSGEPAVEVKNAVNYVQLRKIYHSVIFVRLVYILPSRDEC